MRVQRAGWNPRRIRLNRERQHAIRLPSRHRFDEQQAALKAGIPNSAYALMGQSCRDGPGKADEVSPRRFELAGRNGLHLRYVAPDSLRGRVNSNLSCNVAVLDGGID